MVVKEQRDRSTDTETERRLANFLMKLCHAYASGTCLNFHTYLLLWQKRVLIYLLVYLFILFMPNWLFSPLSLSLVYLQGCLK